MQKLLQGGVGALLIGLQGFYLLDLSEAMRGENTFFPFENMTANYQYLLFVIILMGWVLGWLLISEILKPRNNT